MKHHFYLWDLSLLGDEPLPWPEAQYAVAISLLEGKNLDDMPWVAREESKITADLSSRYLEIFNGGRTLFPANPFDDAVASIAGLILVGFRGALTPLIYTHYQNSNTPKHLEKIFRIFLLFALLMFLFLTLFASDILVIVTTPGFYGASKVVVFLVPAILLGNMYIFSPGIGIAKKTHLIVWVNVVGGLVNIGLNY